MRIAVLSGGVGGARFVRGVREWARRDAAARGVVATDAHAIDVVVNTGDDWWVAGLRIAPDHDSLLYSLSDQNDPVRGWGRADETERVAGELHVWGVAPEWFTLGDLDLGVHIARTAWLREGISLSEVYRRLGARWELGVTLHPATEAEIDTYVHTVDGRRMHFQEWWTRHRANVGAASFESQDVADARPSPAALAALAGADVILVAPSNPVVSIGPILAIPGMADALRQASAPVVGVSPIIGGSVVRGMADACLTAVGVPTDAGAVAHLYGAPAAEGILDGWLVGDEDAAAAPVLTAAGIPTIAVPLWMRDPDTSATLAGDAIAHAIALRG
ncbi:2-phospho-L-lactate transferase [Microbacterium sediminicola]|uniref:2-phospho-L-lactate transferase n=1 Tax=Microbacterium sediminicola TaxID=415210 RepID=A0ABP4UIC5_9MICO